MTIPPRRRHGLAVATVAIAVALAVAGGTPGSSSQTAPLASADAHHPYADVTSLTETDRQFTQLLEAQPKVDPSGRRGAGGRLSSFHAGGRPAAIRTQGQTRLFRTGSRTIEPSLGIAPDGYVYTHVSKIETVGPVFHTVRSVIRTKDGAAFQDVGPSAAGQSTHQYTEDPYLYVDPKTGRIFNNELVMPCQQTSFSDDGGKSWSEAVANCDQADHQTIFAGPPPEGGDLPSGYPNVVYDCAINGGALAGMSSTMTTCDKSLDGGRTFIPTGSPAFVADPAKNVPPGTCDGTTGHGFVDRRGTLYLPRGWCGQPYLAISRDEGASWARVQVAANGMNAGTSGEPDNLPIYDHEAAVAADSSGNIYYFWIAYDYKPYLAISRDGGKRWSKPMMIAPPGVRQAALPALAIPTQATPGHIAFAFMGSANAPTNPYPHTPERYSKATWNGYVVMTTTALDSDPVFFGGPFNDVRDPLVRGVCAPVRCQAEYDFIDVQVSPSGQPWAVLVDACPLKGECAASGESVLGTVIGGPRLGASARGR